MMITEDEYIDQLADSIDWDQPNAAAVFIKTFLVHRCGIDPIALREGAAIMAVLPQSERRR